EHVSGNTYSTTNQKTVVLEGNKPLLCKAIAGEYIDFERWKNSTAQPQGIATNESIRYVFVSEDTIVAHFKPQPFAIYVPNSFSPNNDGINDVFLVSGNAIDLEVFELTIFDRWGQIVFHSTDPKAAWTGEFNQGDYYVDTNVYAYRLTVKSVFDVESRELSGSIQVIR
ncbi:MAG: gliding motility-associated C-terminal domain-containing protein, partial [Flavobacteriales bacterium]